MIGPTNVIDETDYSSFFDHIDDLLDFPADDVHSSLPDCPDAVNTHGENNSSPSLWLTEPDSFPSSDSVFSNNSSKNNSASDLSAELFVPYEDIVQLEWLSNFMEDSFSGGSLTMDKEKSSPVNKDCSHHRFETSSPVSVLESSSSCSGDKPLARNSEMIVSGRRGRARSKRPRPATFTPRQAMQLISPSSSVTDQITQGHQHGFAPKAAPSDSENDAESRLLIKLPKKEVVSEEKKKKKRIKFTVPLGFADTNDSPPQQAVRKCMHCEITKTPQWRAGPMGPKTLCNACGVRYKSGRLFPEYRPAASPTFVPSLHSNSHKKVLEMRNKETYKLVMPGAIATTTTTMRTNSPELIPNNSNLLAFDTM